MVGTRMEARLESMEKVLGAWNCKREQFSQGESKKNELTQRDLQDADR